MQITKEVIEFYQELQENFDLTDFEALQIAVRMQQNRLYQTAHVLDREGHPSALEAIAMELGAVKKDRSIKDALYELAASVHDSITDIKETLDRPQ